MEKYQVPTVYWDFFLHRSGNKNEIRPIVVFLNHDQLKHPHASVQLMILYLKPEAGLLTETGNEFDLFDIL
jgi:hypothetical protein